eukprot:2719048-Prymnesium_polylepis.1
MALSSGQSTVSQTRAIERTAAMHAGELVPVRIDLRSLPPPSAWRSSSSSRKVSSEPTWERSRSVTAASRKK